MISEGHLGAGVCPSTSFVRKNKVLGKPIGLDTNNPNTFLHCRLLQHTMKTNQSTIPSPASVEGQLSAFKAKFMLVASSSATSKHRFIPLGSELYSTSKRKGNSVVDQFGVRVLYPKGTSTGCHWFSLVNGCINEGKGTKIEITLNSTFKATNHLSKKHGIVASKMLAMAANAGRLNQLINVATPGFKGSPSRFYQLQFAAWAAEHSIPFNTFKGDTWNLIANTLPAMDQKDLTNLEIPKHQFKQYLCIKQKLMLAFDKARQYYSGVPFLSFNVNLYQNLVLNLKFLAVCLLWTIDGSIKSKNIGICLYNPLYAQREAQQASDLLMKWPSDLLNKFSISLTKDVYTSIGNGGSDVQCVMKKILWGLREWCLGHIINLCLVDAFGAHHDKGKTKNSEARAVIEAVRKMIEMINKSSKLKTKLEEILIDLVGHAVKLKNSPHHRWAAIKDVLSRVIVQWRAILQAYLSVQDCFPLADHRTVISELYSLIVPVW